MPQLNRRVNGSLFLPQAWLEPEGREPEGVAFQSATCEEAGYPIPSYEKSLRDFLTVQLVGYGMLKGKQR